MAGGRIPACLVADRSRALCCVLPLQFGDHLGGQPRRGGPADGRRVCDRAHRPVPPRRTPTLRRPDRRRDHPGQDRGGLDRRAGPALRVHRQPARRADRPGGVDRRPIWPTTPVVGRGDRGGPARDLGVARDDATSRAGSLGPVAQAVDGSRHGGRRGHRRTRLAAVAGPRPHARRRGLVAAARTVRLRGDAARGGRGARGHRQPDHQCHSAARAECHRHLRPEQGLLRLGSRGGRRAGASEAVGRRNRRDHRERPARQHRHGPGGRAIADAGRCRRGARRRRRHLDRLEVGGVQPGLAGPGVPWVRAVRRLRQP